jgi:hypothetical protein
MKPLTIFSSGSMPKLCIHQCRDRLNKKRAINAYFKLLAQHCTVPNRSKFKDGVFSEQSSKGAAPPVAYNQHKVVKAILQDLPFALVGVFSNDPGMFVTRT